MADSPSTFVPLSLTDTLSRPQRTLHSVHTRPSLSTANSSGHGSLSVSSHSNSRRSSHLPSLSMPNALLPGASTNGGVMEKERETMKKRQKELMCEKLGLGVVKEGEGEGLNEPLSSSSIPSPPTPSNTREDKDEELRMLRNQVLRLNEENKKLNYQVERLQEEVKSASKVGVGSQDGLGASQLKELEKSFAEQESLLAGYQRDAEKQFLTIETMKKQARRYTEILAKTYGPNYETELGLDKEVGSSITTTKILTSTTGITSPAIRNQQNRAMGRMSFGGVGSGIGNMMTPVASRVGNAGGGEDDIKEEEEGDEDGQLSSGDKADQVVNQARQEMMMNYIEGVQTFLRSMEQRLLKRDYELELMEQRAKEEKLKADQKVDQVEKMMEATSV